MTQDDDEAWMLAAAQALGTHATLAFCIALALLLCITALSWRLWRLTVPRLPLIRLPPGGLLALCTGAGFVVIALAGAVFAEMTEALDAEEELGRLDEAFTVALRESVSLAVLRGFAQLTRLGDVATLVALGIAVTMLLLWQGRRWLALGWSIALLGNGLLNPLLKALFARARPLHEHGLVLEAGYSFPSGHSSGAVVSYGMLAYLMLRLLQPRWHLPALLVTTALMFAIACSRVFLQVHYASDVLAGLASGTAWLAVCVLSIEALRQRARSASLQEG